MPDSEMVAIVNRLWVDGLRVMNEAVAMTAEKGPAVAIEWIADYLNGTDGAFDDMVETCPDDWLTRWRVERVN